MNYQRINQAFTLIEIVVALFIIGLLVSLSTMSYVKVRQLSRDSTRLINISQIQSALANYHRDQAVYPSIITSGQALTLGAITYMKEVPTNPRPLEGVCLSTFTDYTYTADLTNGVATSYHIDFCLTDKTSDIPAGANRAIPTEIIHP